MPVSSDDRRRQRRRLAADLADIDFLLPGSVLVHHTRCGNPNCRCKAEPPVLHGPYIQWTRKVNGKTVTRMLSPQQLQRYQPGFDNARRLKQIVAELETLSLLDTDPPRGTPGRPRAPRSNPTQ